MLALNNFGLSNFLKDFYELDHFNRNNVGSLNIQKQNDKYIVSLFAPGYDKTDFDMSISNHILTISASVKNQDEVSENGWIKKEFYINSFKRSISIPENITEDDIDAKYENGILNIQIPIKETKVLESKKILIN